MTHRNGFHARSCRLVLAVVAGLLASGCGGARTGTVAGKVSYRGQPLPGGFVDFISENGQVTTGPIKPDGTYAVAHVPIGPAAITVRDLSGALGERSGQARSLKLPLRYRSPEGSGLRYAVTAGRQEHDFDLPE
jgi:hypothetical protein